VAARIEDYGLIGDLQTAALVSRNGSIDWLCFPRFDSGACFAALLGDEDNGRWSLEPASGITSARRRYRGDTLILETELACDEGVVRLIDFMPPRGEAPDVVRIVEGVEGTVPMAMSLSIRFDYGSIIPWVRRRDDGIVAVAGPDALFLATPVELVGQNFHTLAAFDVHEGDRVPCVLTWYPSNRPPPHRVDAEQALADTESFWHEWVSDCVHVGRFREPLVRSLVTLKALTYAPTGGIVAAATTSLP
jgi:GH15 family glucan-1,4-alpha-glucosidase